MTTDGPKIPTQRTSTGPPLPDITTSPAVLLAGVFAARRSGDAQLVGVFLHRLNALGIHVTFGPGRGAPSQPEGVRV